MPTEAERARKAVQMQITRTIRKIERVHPALAQHLTGNIETGAECTYRGDLADPWEI
jgi:hypothetical protein